MALNVQAELERLESMPISELRAEFRRVWGYSHSTHNRKTLIRRIAWKLQEAEYGGLSERARRRAREIADEALVRVIPPPSWPGTGKTRDAGVTSRGRDERLPSPGTVLSRQYRGKTYHVTVLDEGFDYDGEVYTSLSAVAKRITGSSWNGFRFFGVHRRKENE